MTLPAFFPELSHATAHALQAHVTFRGSWEVNKGTWSEVNKGTWPDANTREELVNVVEEFVFFIEIRDLACGLMAMLYTRPPFTARGQIMSRLIK